MSGGVQVYELPGTEAAFGVSVEIMTLVRRGGHTCDNQNRRGIVIASIQQLQNDWDSSPASPCNLDGFTSSYFSKLGGEL